MRTLFLILAVVLSGVPLVRGNDVPRPREVMESGPGPWGSLESYRVPLNPPEAYFDLFPTPSQEVEWIFHAADETALRRQLAENGFTPDDIEFLLAESTLLADGEIVRLFPGEDTVLNLPLATRNRLYSLLARNRENRFHARPVYIRSDNLSAWFEGSQIPRGAIADIARLAYPTPRGIGYFFSDTPFTLRRVSNSIEERNILRGLLRKQGLIVRLRLSRESLTPEIGEYWTAGYKNKAVMPLLQSVVSANDGASLDIAHLLPATPRQLLNRYPAPADGITGRYPDWFWTCYNFFRFVPSEVHADSPERAQLMLTEFIPTLPPLQFGDMILLNSGDEVVHGCIHIADDIVFTKNTSDIFSPWVLMKLDEVVAYHDLEGKLTLSVFRRMDQPPTGK